MKQLILHIPHSSSNIPLKDGYVMSDEVLNGEILKLTDWYTDDLFQSPNDIRSETPNCPLVNVPVLSKII